MVKRLKVSEVMKRLYKGREFDLKCHRCGNDFEVGDEIYKSSSCGRRTSHSTKLYCPECYYERKGKKIDSPKDTSRRKYLSNVLSRKEKELIAKLYAENLNPQLYHTELLERIGTLDTSPRKIGHVDKLLRKNDGTPDWDKELKVVKKLVKKTYNKGTYKEDYSLTEGDIKRNLAKEFKVD